MALSTLVSRLSTFKGLSTLNSQLSSLDSRLSTLDFQNTISSRSLPVSHPSGLYPI